VKTKLDRRAFALLAAAALALTACSKGGDKITPVTAEDMTLGDPNAKVKVVEYASVTCPHCAQFGLQVFPGLKRRFVDTGKIHYTFKEMLTDPAPVAAAGFLTARCAGKDKYFAVVDAIFKGQQEMFSGAPPVDVLRKIAVANGLSGKQFDACVGDEKALAAIYDRVEKNARDGDVGGTPAFFFNGVKVKEGEITAAEFEAFYNEALKTASR
jgi:protein-disulfide isomerase